MLSMTSLYKATAIYSTINRFKTSNIRIKTNRITTGELIDDKPEEAIDWKELMQTGQEIKMPSFDDSTTHFKELMYMSSKEDWDFHLTACLNLAGNAISVKRATSNGFSKMKNKRKRHGIKSWVFLIKQILLVKLSRTMIWQILRKNEK